MSVGMAKESKNIQKEKGNCRRFRLIEMTRKG